jgi:hypothetical protein
MMHDERRYLAPLCVANSVRIREETLVAAFHDGSVIGELDKRYFLRHY